MHGPHSVTITRETRSRQSLDILCGRCVQRFPLGMGITLHRRRRRVSSTANDNSRSLYTRSVPITSLSLFCTANHYHATRSRGVIISNLTKLINYTRKLSRVCFRTVLTDLQAHYVTLSFCTNISQEKIRHWQSVDG